MASQTLSKPALQIIDSYLHFGIGNAATSVPYFNNKTVRARANLKGQIGKGTTEDIKDEVEAVLLKNHIDKLLLSDEALKKILVDHNLGLDCSAYAFYILDAEARESGKGGLEGLINFVNCTGFLGKIRCSLRPVENCDVYTLAHDSNSRSIPVSNTRPGDIISIMNSGSGVDRDHILVVYEVDYDGNTPKKIHYTHIIAYPEDGVYGTGIKRGTIEISDSSAKIIEQKWSENSLFLRAKNANTELRRLIK